MLRSCYGAPCPGYNDRSWSRESTQQRAAAKNHKRRLVVLHLLLPSCTAGQCRYLSGSLPAHTRMGIARTSTQRCESPPLQPPREICVSEIKCPVCDQPVNNSNPHFDVQAFSAIAYVAGCSCETVSVHLHRYRSHTDEPDA